MNSNQVPNSSLDIIEDDVIFDEEVDIHPIGDPKLLQGLPKTEAFTGYKVEIDKDNYFELNGFILRLNGNEVRIFNLRSIHGHIGADFTRKGDKSLGKIIMDYLTHGDNVELLNILSREINGYNWFDAYNKDFIDVDVHTKEELMGMKKSSSGIIPRSRDDTVEEKNLASTSIRGTAGALQEEENNIPIEHAVITACLSEEKKPASIEHPSIEGCSSGDEDYAPIEHASIDVCSSGDEKPAHTSIPGTGDALQEEKNIIPIECFIKEVRGQGGHLLPQALMNHLHKGITPYIKRSPNDFTYFPIWYINGSNKANADYCELYCPLEVIIHILSKRFVQFKAKLLTLASTDIQLAVEKGEKLDDYTSFRKHQLIEACHAKDDKIDGLIKTVTKQTETIVHQSEQITNLVKKNDEQIKIIQDQTITINKQSSMINDLQATAGTLVNLNYDQVDRIDELIDLNYNTKYKINDMHKEIKYRDKKIDLMNKKIGWVVHEVGKLPMRSVKTTGTNDILVLYTSQMKPVNRGKKPTEEDGQIWIASYNGDEDNFKVPKIPEDAHVIYRISSNRLNSYNSLIENPLITPYILNIYDRSLLINENSIDDFINTVDRVLNEGGQFESVKHLEVLHTQIEERKIERQRRKEHQMFFDLKRHIIETYKTPHIYLGARKRLVYIQTIDEDGQNTLIPLAECDIELAVKQSWWYRSGPNGVHKDDLEQTAIENGKWSSDGDSRIKYEK